MKPKINFVTLAVSDMEKSITFYTQVFDFPVSEKSENLSLFELQDDFYLAIQTRQDFFEQAENDDSQVLSTGFILSHNAESVQEVDAIVEKAQRLGSKKIRTLNENWGYSITFRDINNHHWEIVFVKNNKGSQ
jgi:predicted lactoylglutathione lyase